ncbi:glycosyltransferase [Pararhodonellum marinum]|uniref:glycosyltransferase n=1 Tax=Pararhodonellum marinum TaxID=2755358 RepID=UPI00293B9BDD|nr:glycosyltransferase [Pararhodonellum marinum]
MEQIRLTLIRGLKKEKFEHKIICTWAGGPIAEALEKEDVELIVVGSFKHPFEYKKHLKVLDVIRFFKPHIIHGAIFEGMAMSSIGGWLGKVPIVILEETSEPSKRSRKAIWLQRLFVTGADKIIGISPAVVTYLIDKAKLPKEKVLLVNNGVPLPNPVATREVEQLKFELGISEMDFVIGSVGRVYNEVKRFSDILEALNIIDRSNIKFLLVGDGPDLNKLIEMAKGLHLEKQFVPVGYQQNPNLYYHVMDVFCLPSAHEGFGLVAAEAMLHHIPVIASNVGGLANVVVDEETGFLIPPFSPNSIAKKISRLMEDNHLRKKMGKSGFNRAKEKYTSKRYCLEIENLYLSLLTDKGIEFDTEKTVEH